MANPSRPPPPVTGYPAPPSNGHPPPPYGYPAHPPPPSYYPYNHAPTQYQNQRVTFLRRIIFFSIILFIIFGSILFISWLIIRPRLPEFTLTSLTVKNLTQQGQRISGNFNFNVQVYNPNTKMTAKYDVLEGSVSYKTSVLGATALPPLEQSTKGKDVINGSVSAVQGYVDDWVARGVQKERDERGSVGFDVRLLARVWFKYGAWRTRRRVLTVRCKDVGVSVDKFGSGKMLQNGPKRCDVF